MEALLKAELIRKYKISSSRLILLDYDGTLVDYTIVPGSARITIPVFDILINLINNQLNKLFIITGRGFRDIENILDQMPVNIIAEHGAMIRESGIWRNQVFDNTSWKGTIIPVLEKFTLKCPGAFIEEKAYSLAWHYRNAEYESGINVSRELKAILEKRIRSDNLKLLDGNKVLEIMFSEVGKGRAVKRLFDQNHFDFVLSVGDDVTDEEMFEYLLDYPEAFTIKVGKGNTLARYKLDNINEVILLLKELIE